MYKLFKPELGLQLSKHLCIPFPLVLLTPPPTFLVSYRSVFPAGLPSKSALVLRTIVILILLASVLLSVLPPKVTAEAIRLSSLPVQLCLLTQLPQLPHLSNTSLDRVGQESTP